VPIVQLAKSQSKQSIKGDRYTLPAEFWNSVMSAAKLSLAIFARPDQRKGINCNRELIGRL
jgi:hypothetical protein